MRPPLAVIHARLRPWPLLGLLVGVCLLVLLSRPMLAPLREPDLLAPAEDACMEWGKWDAWTTERQAICAFSPLVKAPSYEMLAQYTPARPKHSWNEPVLLPPGWEGITDSVERSFLAWMLSPWSRAGFALKSPDEKRALVWRYQQLLHDAWRHEVARHDERVLAINRERVREWEEEVAAYEAHPAWLPHPWEAALIAAALAAVARQIVGGRRAVVLGEQGVSLAGRQLPWSAIEEMDWYPERVEVRLFDGTRHIREDLALPEEQVRPMELLTAQLRSA